MSMTEQLISGMVKKICGSYKIKYHLVPDEEPMEVDFTPPFRRVSMLDGLEEVLKCKLPSLDDPDVRKLQRAREHCFASRCFYKKKGYQAEIHFFFLYGQFRDGTVAQALHLGFDWVREFRSFLLLLSIRHLFYVGSTTLCPGRRQAAGASRQARARVRPSSHYGPSSRQAGEICV